MFYHIDTKKEVKGAKRMKVAYIRVSTEEQNTARQEEAMKGLGVEKVYIEKISGKNMERPQLKAMLDFVREGDTLIVESYSRLGRSTADLFKIVDELEKKGVAFVSLKENVDTTTPRGKLMFTIFAGLAQFERECILQRQKEGIAIAKEQGKYKGRKALAKPANWEAVMERVNRKEISKVEACKELGLTRTTFYKMLNEN